MSFLVRRLASFALLLALASPAWADACIPGLFRRGQSNQRFNTPDPEHKLVIVSDPDVKQAELRMPRRLMVAEAAAPEVSTRHALAGLALSVGFVGTGLWCLRFRGTRIPRKKLVVAGVMALLLVGGLAVGNIADANAPAPYFAPVIQLGDIAVNVVIVDQGDFVQLVVPPEMFGKISAR